MASALAYITSSLDALRESTVTEETASAKSLTKKGHPVPTPLTSETLEKLRSLHMSVSHQDDKDGSSEASSEASSPSDMISPTSTAPTSVAGSIPNTPAFADPAKRDLISKELPKENLTLAQRRRIPASAQKFKLYAKLVGKFKEDNEVPILLKRLEEENARLPPQVRFISNYPRQGYFGGVRCLRRGTIFERHRLHCVLIFPNHMPLPSSGLYFLFACPSRATERPPG